MDLRRRLWKKQARTTVLINVVFHGRFAVQLHSNVANYFDRLDVGVFLRKHSEDLCTLLGIHGVADLVRHGMQIEMVWGFEHQERRSGNDGVSACRNMDVARVKCVVMC